MFLEAARNVFFAKRLAFLVCPGNFLSRRLASFNLRLPIRLNVFDAFLACRFAFFARLVTALESEFDFRKRAARLLLLLTFLLTTLIRFATFFFAAFTCLRPALDVADSNFPARYRSVLRLRLAILFRRRSSRPRPPHVSPAN